MLKEFFNFFFILINKEKHFKKKKDVKHTNFYLTKF